MLWDILFNIIKYFAYIFVTALAVAFILFLFWLDKVRFVF